MSDETTDKSAAALDVHIGHMSDPFNLPGLAHFCEHMLFLGKENCKSSHLVRGLLYTIIIHLTLTICLSFNRASGICQTSLALMSQIFFFSKRKTVKIINAFSSLSLPALISEVLVDD